MMALSNRVLVQVNMEQKDYADFAGTKLFLANTYNPNHREKNPVVALVVRGENEIKDGEFIIVHHNHFSDPSPFEIGGGIYSIPYNDTIFAIIDKDGNPQSVCGNIIAERIEEDEIIGIANPKRRHFHDRVRVISDGFSHKVGDEVFTLPFSDYEVVYNWNGQEKRFIRVFNQNIVAIVKKS